MSPLLGGGLLVAMCLSAAAAVAIDRALLRRGRGGQLEIPEFAARQEKPRAVTRLRKDHFTWEI